MTVADNTEMGQLHTENQRVLFRAADEYIDQRWSEWRSWRRLLHAHPELSWDEQHTTEFIQRTLHGFNLELRPGPRGLGGFVELGNTAQGDLIALRGDIDAIPVEEANEVPYCSQFDGIMHACGHDVHTTVVLSVCDTLQHLINSGVAPPSLRARAIFQPAEEVAQGAAECIEAGALENVAAILAMHVDSTRQVGELGLRDHEQTACSDEFDVYIEGSGGHGARPHETSDPIFAATQFINMAYGLVPRVIDARRDVVLCFCEITGGHSANVIPTHVVLKGTLRSFGGDVRARVVKQLKDLATSIGIAHGVEINLQRTTGIPSVNNHPELNRFLINAARSFLPESAVTRVDKSMGGEDFACYQQQVPGTLVRIGSAKGEFGTAHLHSPHFDVDEEIIRVACRLFTRAILNWSHAESPLQQ